MTPIRTPLEEFGASIGPPGFQNGSGLNVKIGSSPGAASHLDMAEVQELKAQIMEMNAAMIEQAANMKILTDLVAKLTAPASSPAPAPAPQPAPATQPEPPDHWATGWQQHQAGIAVAQPGQTAPPLRPIHPKDIEKPEKYDLTGDGWLEWSRHFVRFLDRNDAPHYRWTALLKSIEGFKGKPVTASDEATWAADLAREHRGVEVSAGDVPVLLHQGASQGDHPPCRDGRGS